MFVARQSTKANSNIFFYSELKIPLDRFRRKKVEGWFTVHCITLSSRPSLLPLCPPHPSTTQAQEALWGPTTKVQNSITAAPVFRWRVMPHAVARVLYCTSYCSSVVDARLLSWDGGGNVDASLHAIMLIIITIIIFIISYPFLSGHY